MIKGKTPEEIRKTFNIKNDFTPGEEEQVRKENEWTEEKTKMDKRLKRTDEKSQSSAMAADAAMTPFDSLSDEIVLKIFQMTALELAEQGQHYRQEYEPKEYDHDFLADVLCKVSVRFRRIASDSSLWKEPAGITIKGNDFSKLEFMIGECLNNTEVLTIWADPRYLHPRFPNRYLVDLATMVPNLKMVWLCFFEPEEDIPAPWKVEEVDGWHRLTHD